MKVMGRRFAQPGAVATELFVHPVSAWGIHIPAVRASASFRLLGSNLCDQHLHDVDADITADAMMELAAWQLVPVLLLLRL